MAIIANILIIILEILGLRASKIGERKWTLLAYYTQLSNLVTLISSVCFLMTAGGVAPLRYLSTCMLALTFLVTIFILAPMGGGFKKMMLSGNGLYHHTLCPILSILSYLFLEPHVKMWYLPIIVTTVYGLIMLYLNGKRYFDGPYPFFRVHNQSAAATVLWMAALIGLISLLSVGIGHINVFYH
jgi:hypothetical protein